VNKIALSANDDKRIIEPDKIQRFSIMRFSIMRSPGEQRSTGKKGELTGGKGGRLGPRLGAKETGAKSPKPLY